MKQYGVKESWSMCFEIPTDDLYFLNRPHIVVPLYITKKGDLILQINYRKLFIYDQKQKILKSIQIKYPKTGLHLIGDSDNQPFYAITLLDSLIDIQNCHEGGLPFLGRQIKQESTLSNSSGNCITVNMGSDSANNSAYTGSEYRKMLGARFLEVVFNTPDSKLYKLFKECKRDLGAATKKFSEQVQRLVLSEFESHLKREFGVSGDSSALNLMKEILESDYASIKQMQFENGSVSSAPESLNDVAVPIPEFTASLSYAPMQNSLEYRFYQLIRNTQLDWSVYRDLAARLAMLRVSSKFVPQLKPEIEATLEQLARYVNASSDSVKDSGVASKLSVMDANDASVSSTPERVNNDVCGAPNNQNHQLPALGEGKCTKAKSTEVHRADGISSPEYLPSKDYILLRS